MAAKDSYLAGVSLAQLSESRLIGQGEFSFIAVSMVSASAGLS